MVAVGVSARSQRETLQRLTSAWPRCWVRRGPMPEARRARRGGESGVLARSCAGIFSERGVASILAAADELRASRVGWGDVPRLGQGAGHPRITQRRHVGALEPKLHSLGVAG